jgi:serine/threonine protein kinase
MDTVANYPVIRKLGEGATSEVFLCQDPFRNREVAVKRIFPEALRDPTRGRLFRKLFFTEASLAGKLVHPHIAQIFDAGIGEDSGYIVMEYIAGGTMERYCAPENLLPAEQVVEIIFKCTRALAYAHMQGVTHRDIKPGNLLYASSPTDVRITDFGLAQNVALETTQITGVGSPAYMSPEQIREELVDHRTDLYSLGVVMYQLLTGVLPFRGTNKFSMIYQITQSEAPPPSSERPEVPESLDRIVRRALQKEAAKRYHSADEFAADLIEALRAGLGKGARESFGDAD